MSVSASDQSPMERNTVHNLASHIFDSCRGLSFSVLGPYENAMEMVRKVSALRPEVKKKLYGQIFTPVWVADYMANLCIKEGNERGIEPCFGRGIFVTTIAKRLLQLDRCEKDRIWEKITGVEIDPVIFLEGVSKYLEVLGNKTPLRNLYLGSFFDYKEGFSEFDFGIMNPPYVRQEDLSSDSLPPEIRKESLVKIIKRHTAGEYVNKRANLYVYFFIYLTNFIKPGGKIVAITYNSWLFSKFGRTLQKFFLDNFKIQYIIDFDKEAFEDALIGSCIIVLEKTAGEENKKSRDENIVQFVRLKSKAPLSELVDATESDDDNSKLVRKHKIKQANLYLDSKWEKYFFIPEFHQRIIQNENVAHLKKVAEVLRGIDTKSNRFFILDSEVKDRFRIDKMFLTEFLKDPREVRGRRTSGIITSTFLLNAPASIDSIRRNGRGEGLRNYLLHVETEIEKDKNKYRTLLREIKDNKDTWYVQKLKSKGDIIFSYIIRGNKNFCMNDAQVLTSGNFHNIKAKVDKYALFAVLNSTLTKYLLEFYGRTQGSGLLKVQVYELKDLIIPDITKMDDNAISELSKLGKDLSILPNKNGPKEKEIIRRIDDALFDFLNLCEIKAGVLLCEKKIVKDRISRKTEQIGVQK